MLPISGQNKSLVIKRIDKLADVDARHWSIDRARIVERQSSQRSI